MRHPTIWYTWHSASGYRHLTSCLHSVLTRRPIAATCWRKSRLRHSTSAVLIFHRRLARIDSTASRAEHDAVLGPNNASTPRGFDDLGIEELREWHPAR